MIHFQGQLQLQSSSCPQGLRTDTETPKTCALHLFWSFFCPEKSGSSKGSSANNSTYKMSLLVYLWNNPSTLLTAVVTTAIGTIIYKLFVSLYIERTKYPPGPVPLPILGNVLQLRKTGNNSGKHLVEIFNDLSKKYGSIFTINMGMNPVVMVTGSDKAIEACSKLEFAGRMDTSILTDMIFSQGSMDIFFADYSREWAVLRKVAHSAIRKFAVSAHLPPKVAGSAKEVVQEIINREGLDKPFDPTDYLFLLTHSVLAKSAYGVNFTMDHPDFKMLKDAMETIQKQANEFFLCVLVPILRFWFRTQWKKSTEKFRSVALYNREQMKKHRETFNSNEIRDFCDALLSAKTEAESESSKDAKFLTSENVTNILTDIFLAGTDSVRMTLQWMLLLLANEPDLQKRIRNEIQSKIGDDTATLKHKANCHLTSSFIAELLRFRPIAGFAFHKAITDATVGEHKVPKNSFLFISLLDANWDEKTFPEADKFKPDRFLRADGTFYEGSLEASLPFGCQGRRTCPGNKFAIADVFMMLVGLLQNTKGYTWQLENGPGSHDYAADPDNITGYVPSPYKLKLTKN